MTPAVKAIDRAVGGLISTVVKNGYFKAKTGDTLLLHGRGWPFSRLMLVGAEKDGRGWVQALSNLDKRRDGIYLMRFARRKRFYAFGLCRGGILL